ncbi:hypothetical protein RJT34_12461 [Clitoria ternatea]|uniref:Uncharacterized protein n=1 Tax=Clitoria ternatea TaxID=43366 RepID=A0AAN9PKY1_CLITE
MSRANHGLICRIQGLIVVARLAFCGHYRVLVHKEKNKVLFAEPGKDFVDVLLSFLTLRRLSGENTTLLWRDRQKVSLSPGSGAMSCFAVATECTTLPNIHRHSHPNRVTHRRYLHPQPPIVGMTSIINISLAA